jgi:DNA polymerase-3 subunit epsilon
MKYSRQIVLDTETTGLEPREGHRIIEIGCVEIINRRLTGNNYHQYLQPDREIDAGAAEVHGITDEFLLDKPRFADVVGTFMDYIRGAELIIHNAPFDVGFLNHELNLVGKGLGTIAEQCGVIDTLVMARKAHPGKKNNLDALCNRYAINNSHRDLHGALLDAEILADLYLVMTGGQTTLSLGNEATEADGSVKIERIATNRPALKVIRASTEELALHQQKLAEIEKGSGACLWLAPAPATS